MCRRLLRIVPLLACACDEHVGCAPVLRGEAEQLEFSDQTIVVGTCERLHALAPILAGSRFCPSLSCNEDVEGCRISDDEKLSAPEVAACHVPTISGPATAEGACVLFDAAGEVTWSFEPVPCAANENGYAPAADALHFTVVDPADVIASFDSPGDGFARRELDPGPASEFPADVQLAPGATAVVLADHAVHLAVVLRDPAQAVVGWNPGDWQLASTVVAGDPPTLALDEWGVVELAMTAGSEVDLAIVRGEVELAVGRVRAVADGELESIDLVIGYLRTDDGYGPPIGARAVFRTGDGTPVLGADVDWEVTEGALPVWRDDELAWDADFVALMDREGKGCHAPPEKPTEYVATVIARHGDLEATETMTWVVQPPDESAAEEIKELFTGEDHDDSELCEGPGFPEQGCGCDANGNGRAGMLAMLLGFGFAAVRRRRALDCTP